MKVNGLVQWKKERLGDMFGFYRNTSFCDLVQRYLEHPNDIDGQKQLSTWIGAITKYYEYDEVFLLDVKAPNVCRFPNRQNRSAHLSLNTS